MTAAEQTNAVEEAIRSVWEHLAMDALEQHARQPLDGLRFEGYPQDSGSDVPDPAVFVFGEGGLRRAKGRTRKGWRREWTVTGTWRGVSVVVEAFDRGLVP